MLEEGKLTSLSFFLNRFYEHRLRSLQELTFHEKGPLIRMWEEDINAMNFFNN